MVSLSSSINDPDELFLDDYESVISSRFNKEYPVRFFIHGFGHHANCSFPQEIKDSKSLWGFGQLCVFINNVPNKA